MIFPRPSPQVTSTSWKKFPAASAEIITTKNIKSSIEQLVSFFEKEEEEKKDILLIIKNECGFLFDEEGNVWIISSFYSPLKGFVERMLESSMEIENFGFVGGKVRKYSWMGKKEGKVKTIEK